MLHLFTVVFVQCLTCYLLFRRRCRLLWFFYLSVCLSDCLPACHSFFASTVQTGCVCVCVWILFFIKNSLFTIALFCYFTLHYIAFVMFHVLFFRCWLEHLSYLKPCYRPQLRERIMSATKQTQAHRME